MEETIEQTTEEKGKVQKSEERPDKKQKNKEKMNTEKTHDSDTDNPTLQLNNRTLTILGILLIIITAYVVMGGKSVLVLGLMTFFFVIPFYFLLGLFSFTSAEQVVFSLFVGLGGFPLLSYYLYPYLGSLRLAIIVSLIIFYVGALVVYFYKKKSE